MRVLHADTQTEALVKLGIDSDTDVALAILARHVRVDEKIWFPVVRPAYTGKW